MNNIELSVIIVSYKNLEIIVDCLNSIYKNNDIGNYLEVIVVDNSPEDNIYNYVADNFENVRIIKNQNKGFGEGNNKGACIARGKYLLFLNPDTILVEPIFGFAINQFMKDNNLGLFGVKLVDRQLKRNMSFYLMDKYGFICSQIIKVCNRLDLYIDGKMFISGADMFIRKDVFIKIGMFDENIFMYYEEPDLIRRIKLINKKTKYFKYKKIIHLEGKTSEKKETSIIRRLKSAHYYSLKNNLNFHKQLNCELRYNYFKLIIYKIFRSKKAKICLSDIRIIKQYKRIN